MGEGGGGGGLKHAAQPSHRPSGRCTAQVCLDEQLTGAHLQTFVGGRAAHVTTCDYLGVPL